MTRKVPVSVAWQSMRAVLSRVACIYGDPKRDEHDHSDCLRDDESYIADMLLDMVHGCVAGDQNRALDTFTKFYDTLDRERH